ncbi:MAG: hypothetical protein EP330_01435 [Deltaproteobacteria bacterium]|nr:MAG: hypothetical protein EP330_01435 [Deltaproteobacteria bacterium]
MRYILLLPLLGCTPQFDSFADACMDRTPGQAAFDSKEDAPAVKMVHRVNCWRRLAGARKVRVSKQLSDAATAHAEYVVTNGYEATNGGLFEDPSLPGYTGEDPIERGMNFGYDWGASTIAFWEATEPLALYDAVTYADIQLHDIYGRQVVFQPGLEAVGYGRAGDWVVSEWHYQWPTNYHTNRPLIWPLEDMTNVPISAPFLDDDLQYRTRGYAISAHMGSANDADLFQSDPYDILLRAASLTGPDGEVEIKTMTPSTALGNFPYSAAIIPLDPLEPETTYTVFLDLAWSGEERQMEWSFTTGTEGVEL